MPFSLHPEDVKLLDIIACCFIYVNKFWDIDYSHENP